MKRRSLLQAAVAIPLASLLPAGRARVSREGCTLPMAFGYGGAKKMLYDVRQRPQALYFNGKVFIGFSGGGSLEEIPKENRRASTYAKLLRYDPRNREFSETITFGKSSNDHHDCPVLWVDKQDHLHFIYKCHNEPGVHLVAKQPRDMGSSVTDWLELPQIAPMVAYPTMFKLFDDSELIYFRTGGHSSSWSYRITSDNGRSWSAPDSDVTNMDIYNHPEWSSYQAKIMSPDRKTLYTVFTDYDDVKSNDPRRLYNPRYDMPVRNEWKYNLSMLKIDVRTHEVSNDAGELMKTPVDIETARDKCQIWDTEWRGAGVPPALCLDDNGYPMALHVLSEDDLTTHNYYFVRKVGGEWLKTPITASNHQWNSGYLGRDEDGHLHAYLIVGDGYVDRPGVNYTHGGGRIEHWTSKDKGDNWSLYRDITPDPTWYPGWSFNNVQPVVRPDGSVVDGMLVFYGWLDPVRADAVAFLLDESGLAMT